MTADPRSERRAASTAARNLLFDLDGTLTDPREGILSCIEYALGRLNRPVPPASSLLECIGPPLHISFRRLVGEELTDSALNFYRDRFRTKGIFENRLYPGVPKALSALRSAGHSLRVVTSKPAVFARQIVEHFELEQYFADVHGPDLDGNLADKTELLKHVLASGNIKPAQATMLGDRSFDIVGARNNGIRAAAALWGYGSQSELLEAGADELYDSISAFADAVLLNQPH